MRLPLAITAVFLAAACTGGAPYSNVIDTAGGGVGFSDYAQYMRAQEELSRIRRAEAMAAARSAPPAAQPETSRPAAQVGFQPQGFGSAQTQVPQQPPLGQPAPNVAASPATAQGFNTGQALAAAPAPAEQGISAQTYEAQPFGTPAQNRVVRRDFVPQVRVTEAEAPAASGPNLFVYALSTTHAVGQERHARRNPFRWGRWEAACAQYPHQDLAQEAFLAAGGPERDPENMDPDGDGYACWWDPTPFRQAATTVKARE